MQNETFQSNHSYTCYNCIGGEGYGGFTPYINSYYIVGRYFSNYRYRCMV